MIPAPCERHGEEACNWPPSADFKGPATRWTGSVDPRYLPNGGFMVADAGNRRPQRSNRLGYWDATIGGPFDAHNPLVAPL